MKIRNRITDEIIADVNDLKTDLAGMNLKYADMTFLNLRNADLSETDLTGANLTGSDLIGANLTGTRFKSAILNTTQLANGDTIVSENQMINANLTGAVFNGKVVTEQDSKNFKRSVPRKLQGELRRRLKEAYAKSKQDTVDFLNKNCKGEL